MSESSQNLVYECGQWLIHLGRRELLASGVSVLIGARAFEILVVLVQSANELVTKAALMDRIWPGAIIGENTLQVHISAIRKALNRDRDMLSTVSGRGYRLLGDWVIRRESAPETPREPEPARMPAQSFRTNLPETSFELIGRSDAVRQIQDLLSAYRAITLTGPGGIGKTTLALHVSRRISLTFSGDVWLVELASLSDPGLVPSAVAGVLRFNLGGEEITAEAVARAIGDTQLLLVLDNCEHVIDAAAILADTILRLCPRAIVLATSQELLRIAGEYVYRVAPLEVPPRHWDEAGDVLEHSAVRLFVARLQALDSTFTANRENVHLIAAICQRLDGIPLAIEFAAAGAAALGVQNVASRLTDRFQLLTMGRRTALPKQRTLRAALDWSHDLLPKQEQSLLSRLAIFAAGFTSDAAAAVVSDASYSPPAVLEGIASLVAKSFVILDRSSSSGRWALPETIRAYALEKLVESGEVGTAARHHAMFYNRLLGPGEDADPDASIDDTAGHAQEIDNVRAALDWAFSPDGDAAIGVGLTAAYAPVWLHSSLMVECHERTTRALAHPGAVLALSAPLQMRLHLALGLSATYTMGSVEIAESALARALEIAESLDDLDSQLRILWASCIVPFSLGKCDAAQVAAERFAHVALRTGDPADVLAGERLIGNTMHFRGFLQDAQNRFEHVLEHYFAPKDQRHSRLLQYDQRPLARAMLARVLGLRGFLDQASREARVSLEEARTANHGLTICGVLDSAVCPVALMNGDLATADRAVTMLIDLSTNLNAPFWKAVGRCRRGKLLILRGEVEAGTEQLLAERDASETTGWPIFVTEYKSALAEGLARLGLVGEAVVVVDEALATAEMHGERWYLAELLRTKGELLLLQASDGFTSAAEECLRGAIGVAREQGALLWELRAAFSLARLRAERGLREAAKQTLAPVYGRFIEGFAAADMRGARALLDALQPYLGA